VPDVVEVVVSVDEVVFVFDIVPVLFDWSAVDELVIAGVVDVVVSVVVVVVDVDMLPIVLLFVFVEAVVSTVGVVVFRFALCVCE
jgi:hypothetical protein